MKGLDLPIVVSFSFIFNVRVNPDNADNTVSIRHPSGKIVIPNDNFGINSRVSFLPQRHTFYPRFTDEGRTGRLF
jgi:hypothetical protein